MKITKGQKIIIKHFRRGKFKAIAKEDFDTENNEWYPCILDQDYVKGLSRDWIKGEDIPARRGLCTVNIIQ